MLLFGYVKQHETQLTQLDHISQEVHYICTLRVHYIIILGLYSGRDIQPLNQRVADEMLRALNGKGYAYSKKLAHHKVAHSQKAYMNTYWMGLTRDLEQKYKK